MTAIRTSTRACFQHLTELSRFPRQPDPEWRRGFLAPVLPGLTDAVATLDDALSRLAAAGASGVSVVPLHLRPGTREWFLLWLAREHPQLMGLYRELYRTGAYVPASYRRWLDARLRPLLDKHGFAGGGGYGGTSPRDGRLPGGAAGGFSAGSLPEAADEQHDEGDQLTLC